MTIVKYLTMSKYRINDKYSVTDDSSEPKLTKKYRRKSSTAKADLHPRSRSLSLGSSLSAPQLMVVEISESIKSPKSPLGKGESMENLDVFRHLAAKGNPLVYDNMYGYKVGLCLIVCYSLSFIELDCL